MVVLKYRLPTLSIHWRWLRMSNHSEVIRVNRELSALTLRRHEDLGHYLCTEEKFVSGLSSAVRHFSLSTNKETSVIITTTIAV